MILHIDHLGLVARSYDEAADLLLGTFGLVLDDGRNPEPDVIYMARENADIYFVKVGGGETRIELLLPRDASGGMGRWLQKRGPSVHHIAFMVDDVALHSAELRDKGLRQIDLGPDAAAAFFQPKDTMGILTELVDVRTMDRLHETARPGGARVD
ncbi:MAG: VOC family protein [Pseudonocardia sp.]|nr:VOC family protein [Pseudonocardia sp.]